MGTFSRNWKISGLVALVSSAVAAVTQAQLTVNPNGIWLESDTGLSAPGGTVASWTDQANGLVFTPAGVDGAPTAVTSTLPSAASAVQFTGGALDGLPSGPFTFHDQRLASSGVDASLLSSTGPEGTIFIVERPSTPGAFGQTSFGWRDNPDASASSQLIGRQDLSGGTIVNSHGDPAGSVTMSAPGGFYDNWHLIVISRNGGGGFIRIDQGAAVGSGTFSGSSPSGTGTALVGTDLYSGQIAAVLAYSTALGESDILATENYLQNKYFTAVPEPSQYAMVFSLACVAGVIVMRYRRSAVA